MALQDQVDVVILKQRLPLFTHGFGVWENFTAQCKNGMMVADDPPAITRFFELGFEIGRLLLNQLIGVEYDELQALVFERIYGFVQLFGKLCFDGQVELWPP